MLALTLIPEAFTLALALHVLLIIGVGMVIYWLISKNKIPEPFHIVAWVLLAALAIYLLFYLLA